MANTAAAAFEQGSIGCHAKAISTAGASSAQVVVEPHHGTEADFQF
jgi:hypothetical protein